MYLLNEHKKNKEINCDLKIYRIMHTTFCE